MVALEYAAGKVRAVAGWYRIATRTAARTPHQRAGTTVLLAMELEAEARRHPLAIALAEFPARLVQQAVA